MSNEKKNDGGPAYPTDSGEYGFQMEWKGMSLRDHFAGLAMQGCIASAVSGYKDDNGETVSIDEFAYLMADRMLKAREQ